MDKYEYRIRAEEINDLIEKKEYVQAVKIADTIDWRRVRSVVMLCKISELYKINRRYEDSKEVLLLAYELQSNSRKIIYSLCELSIKLDEIVQAIEYYKEFIKVAPRDTGRFILQYRIYTAQDVSLEERIAVLEEYQTREYREKWMYELAYLYHRIGLATRCIEQCDDIVVWFGEGKYVIKALELKMLHAPLSPEQQEIYNARFMVPKEEEIPEKTEEEQTEAEVEPSLSIEIKSVEATKAKTEEIPSKKVNEEIEEQEETPIEEELYAQTETIEYPGVDSVVYPEEYPVEYPEEEVSSEVSEEEPAEDEDMKIVDTSDDMDIQVKTIDVGDEYNTINLQDELAKSLAEMFAQEDMEAADATRALPIESIFEATKEIPNEVTEEVAEEIEEEIPEEVAEEIPEEIPEEVAEEIPEEIPEEVVEEISEEIPEEVVEEIAEEIPEVEEIEEVEEPTQEIYVPVEEMHEIEFSDPEEEDSISEETVSIIEEVVTEEPTEEPAPTVEPLVFNQNQPLSEAFIQAVQNAAMEAAKEAAKQAAAEAASEAAKQAAQATAEAMKEMKSEPVAVEVTEEEPVLEVTEEEPQSEEMVEKQITGQLSFSDIMAEWEETKKANEEKHLQEMKQRVMEQTSPLLSDFDAAARASVQSDLDMLSPMLEVFPEEDRKEVEAEVAPITVYEEEPQEDALVSEVEEALMEELPQEPALEQPEVVEPVIEEPEVEEPQQQPVDPETEDRPSSFNTEEINGLEEKLMGALENQHYDTANLQASVLENEMAKSEVAPEVTVVTPQPEAVPSPLPEVVTGPRTLTLDEKALFGGIAPNKELQEKVAEVLDKASLLPYTNNIIISGEKETGTMETAEKLVQYFAQANRSFSGKSKKFSSEEFTGKDIFAIVNELPNGVMIIDNAGEMSADLCNKLIKAGNEMASGGILYILVDTVSGIERLQRTYAKITEYFNLRIHLSALDNDGLVKYGKRYAREKEYSIDDMGVLALYNRIEERQTNEHAVTVDEVKEIINQAIEKSEKKSLSHFMDVLIAKRYDKEDMIILREKDFMND